MSSAILFHRYYEVSVIPAVLFVIPAEAGIQYGPGVDLDARVREHDGVEVEAGIHYVESSKPLSVRTGPRKLASDGHN